MRKKGGGTTVREEVGGVRDGGARRTGGRRIEARGYEGGYNPAAALLQLQVTHR